MPTSRSVSLAAALTLLAVPLAAQINNLPQNNTADYCPVWASSLPAVTPGQAYSAPLGTNVSGAVIQSQIPTLEPLPPGLSVVAGTIQGTTTSAATGGMYMFTARYETVRSCPGYTNIVAGTTPKFVYTKSFSLSVRDVDPPKIKSFSVDQPNIGAGGGTVVLTAAAYDNLKVQKVNLVVVYPDGHRGILAMTGPSGQAAGQWQASVPIALNVGGTPIGYGFSVLVEDAGGNVTRGGPISTTVAGRTPILNRP